MPAPCMSLAGQQRNWKQAAKAPFPRLSLLPEECKMKGNVLDTKSIPEQKRTSFSPSAQISNHRRNGNTAAESQTLKVDERLRLARERREEHLKQLASRERSWLVREERAQRFYEKHLEERRKKIEEQRQREERRRNAVEEKRRQRLKEERERYESVLQKTMERSQKAKQRSIQRRVCNTKNNANAKHRSLSQWEISLVNRLQTPTIAYLARSRSAVSLSSGEVSCHPMSKSNPQKPSGTSTHSSAIRHRVNNGSHQTSKTKPGLNHEKREGKKPQSHSANVPVSASSGTEDKTISLLSGLRLSLRESPSQECLPTLAEEDVSGPESLLNSRQFSCDQSVAACSRENVGCGRPVQQDLGSNGPQATPARSLAPNEQSVGVQSRLSAGTTDPEEASRLLAEKRRQARIQREREEEARRQREETERQRREELAHRRAEEQARREAEARCEEKRIREEEEQRKAEEEQAQKQREEESRLQQQKEEEEKQRLERETRFQKEETERQERKKRLEEIMKRTRKTDAEKMPALSSTPMNENIKPLNRLPRLPLEDVIQLPSPAKGSLMNLTNDEDILPTVAFKERRSIRTLTHLEEIQAHQRAEVI